MKVVCLIFEFLTVVQLLAGAQVSGTGGTPTCPNRNRNRNRITHYVNPKRFDWEQPLTQKQTIYECKVNYRVQISRTLVSPLFWDRGSPRIYIIYTKSWPERFIGSP